MKFALAENRRRNIIQIAVDGEFLIALCNDGTLWRQTDKGDWRKLPDVQQPSRQEWEKREEEAKLIDNIEKCPKCGATDFAIARDMRSTRFCKCGTSWLPGGMK